MSATPMSERDFAKTNPISPHAKIYGSIEVTLKPDYRRDRDETARTSIKRGT
jgi:hypothetical protein